MAATSRASASSWRSRRKARSGCGSTAMSRSRNRPSSPPSRCTTISGRSLFHLLAAEPDADQPDDAGNRPGRHDQNSIEAGPQSAPERALDPVQAGRKEFEPDVVHGEVAAFADDLVINARYAEQSGHGDENKSGDAQGRHAAIIARRDRFGIPSLAVKSPRFKQNSRIPSGQPAPTERPIRRNLGCCVARPRWLGSAPFRSLAPRSWRDGRVVEGARLESAYTVKSRIVGSNPTPSARSAFVQSGDIGNRV